SEIIGKPIARLVPKYLIDEEFYILEKIREGESIATFETKRIRKDKKIIDVSLTISPVRDRNGNVTGASKIVRDITRQKQLNEALRQSEERLRMACES